MNAGSGGRWFCLFWSVVKKVVFVEDILEDATDIEVAVNDLVATVTVCGPEEAKLVVTVLQVGVG